MKPIALLPETVSNQIAAGEVIQRPASAIKELMENALDAGGSHIEVNIQQAGKVSMQVIDNGHGIPEGDMDLAFQRHATSKIQSADDLFALQTMGFRGEALASIAAVSHVSIVTRTDRENSGRQRDLEGGRLVKSNGCSTAIGTKITISNLFYNVPARRQFLKSDAVEYKHIARVFADIALAHPDKAFTLRHQGKVEWMLAAEHPRQRITHIIGKKVTDRLVPVDEQTDFVEVKGYVLRPIHARKTKGEQHLFVNHRPVNHALIHRAVMDAFEGLIQNGHHPAYILDLTIASDRIDVNVHPAKTEVQFDDERAIQAIVRSAVKRALGIHQVAPTLDFENPLAVQPVHIPTGPVLPPQIVVDSSFNPFQGQDKIDPGIKTDESCASSTKDHFFDKPIHVPGEVLELSSEWAAETATVGNTGIGYSVMHVPPHFAVTTMQRGLMTVHLPRAKRRILFSQLLAQLQGEHLGSQSWLFPQPWNAPSGMHWGSWEPRLESLGYRWELHADTMNWLAGPSFLNPDQAMSWLENLLLIDPDQAGWESGLVSQWLDHCDPMPDPCQGEPLSLVIDRLFALSNPWKDDKGRSIARLLDSDAIAAQFTS